MAVSRFNTHSGGLLLPVPTRFFASGTVSLNKTSVAFDALLDATSDMPSLLNRTIEFYSCFISYSRSDKKFARQLYDLLRKRGINCWLDDHQMLPGDDIYDRIQQGIRLWDKVLLCCSEASLTSWWVDNEIDTAFDKERHLMTQRQRKVLVLIPLNLDGFMFNDKWKSGKAEQVKSRIAADFSGWEKDNRIFEREFTRVVSALRTNAGDRETPPLPKI